MVKAEFKVICRVYGVKPKALKQRMKKDGLKVKGTTKREVLNTIFIHAPDLMFTRDLGDATVEYLYPELTKELIDDMSVANGKEINNEK